VGGIWRALAHVDMEQQNYPLRVLHHYVIPAGRALKLCRVVSGLSRKSLEKMRSVPKRRAEALPYGTLVLEEMIEVFGLKEIVVSAYGLREGVLQRKLKPEEVAKDPLIAFAQDMNAREARTPGHAPELFDWMAPLFPKETQAERRVRHLVEQVEVLDRRVVNTVGRPNTCLTRTTKDFAQGAVAESRRIG
jgi:exopolyphosphatase/guanosine-5'-triphosphate,3'-diphosphate pyrophosphatase